MNVLVHLSEVIAHLGTAAVQRSWLDDRIILDHIDAALEAARALKECLEQSKDA